MESARVAAATSDSHAGAARFRTMGRRAGAVVLLGDLAKGALAADVGLVAGSRGVGVACGVLVVARHGENLVRLRRGDERTLAP
ncbi:MAG TPA: hypothetical protein VGP53_03800 [Acidimicrobiales bacterium]|nr:hypothetical protein [Acidimicrobiales bacterium]